MIRETLFALRACVVTFVFCAVLYPLVVWGAARAAFPEEAAGSLILGRDREVIGSSLIAQPFVSDRYFRPRPSAVDDKADAAGGSNLGTKNPALRERIAKTVAELGATKESPVPADLVTASGSGLDPHITVESARYQAKRVAQARNMSVDRVDELIDRFIDRSGAILGAPARVNVLLLNIALDDDQSARRSSVSEPD